MSAMLEQEAALEDPQEESLALALGIDVPKMSDPSCHKIEDEKKIRRNWRLLALGESEDSYYS